jgi:SRSO17 transposase
MKTMTPELTPEVLQRLKDYAALFRDDFQRSDQERWNCIYLQGLLQDGERKSVEPLAARVAIPPHWDIEDPAQALQQFVNQSPWDEQQLWVHYRHHLAGTFASPRGAFLIDDTSWPKQGRHSVGVQRQYCGALGKRANCQVAVSVHYHAPRGHYPLALRLFLPQSWTRSPSRLDQAGVPRPCRRFRSKIQIALELLDQVRDEGLPGNVVIADAGYGASEDFRQAVAERGLFYLAGVKPDMVVFAEPPLWEVPAGCGHGPKPTRWQLTAASPQPLTVAALAARTPLRRKTWRIGSQKKGLWARFAWVRVWPAHNWQAGQCAQAAPLWLLIEKRNTGEVKYAFSNLPEPTTCLQAVRWWKSRWPVEQGYQQMKEELGLDHFEGRSWRGFHHHACLVMLAYGFLVLERLRGAQAGEKPLPWRTLPALRRALQRFFQPRFPLECPHCHGQIQHPLLT